MKILIEESVLRQARSMMGTDDIDVKTYREVDAAIADALDAAENVEPLGEPFASILAENLGELYETEDKEK